MTDGDRDFQPSIPFPLCRYSPLLGRCPPQKTPPPHSSALKNPRIHRICDVSLQTTSFHLFLGFPTCLAVFKFPFKNFFLVGDTFIFQSHNMTIFRQRVHFLNCLFPFRGTTNWTFVRKEKTQILLRQMGKNTISFNNNIQGIDIVSTPYESFSESSSKILCSCAQKRFVPTLNCAQKHDALVLKIVLFLSSTALKNVMFLRSNHCVPALKTFCSCAQKHCVPALKNTVFLR